MDNCFIRFENCKIISFIAEELYTNNEWFQVLKNRWAANHDDLEKYFLKMMVRYNETGESLKKYEHYPTDYR